MINSLILHSIRALNRQKGYILINILGLSLGIACSLVITLFILHELSYDQFNEKKDRIYRLLLNGKLGGQEVTVSSTAAPIGPTMLRDFAEIEDYCRFDTWGETVIKYNEQSFTENSMVEADSSFFNIFSLPLLRGDSKTVLNARHKVVLSKSTALKIFGKADAMDKMLRIGNDTALFQVTGIMEDIPENSSFRANLVGSFLTNNRANDNQWLSNSYTTFLLLKPKSTPAQVNSKMPEMIKKYVGPAIIQLTGMTMDEFLSKGNKYNMYLQPLADIHMNTRVQHDLKPSSDPKYLRIFGSIAILIIIIAAINFMNLSTAQASKRAKEVGMKKVAGSSRRMLTGQFITESLIMALISLVVAIVIVEVMLPFFNNLLGSNLSIGFFNNYYTIPSLLGLAAFVGLLAGSYPAFYLSSFSPLVVFKGKIQSSILTIRLRSILVVLQFSISIILIVGTLIMFRQIRFMLNKDLGYNKEQLLVITSAETIGNKVKTFKESLSRLPGVIKVSASTALPQHSNNDNGYLMEGRSQETFLLQTNFVDYDYFETLGIKLTAGRSFSEAFPGDKDGCIVNESAVKNFNLVNPLTARFIDKGDKPEDIKFMPILGVVKNFHYASLRSEIEPYMFRFKNEYNNWGYISVRLAPNANSANVKEIEKVWKEFANNEPMQYFFMDEDYARVYKEEKQNSKLSILFAVLAVLIASLGLYGLTSYTVEQRTREIGIRKALGASIAGIFNLISKEIIVLICYSTLIAWPLIYIVAKNWLQNYYYRINLNAFDFLYGFIIASIIAILTLSYRIILAARLNPAVSLHYE